MGAAEALGGGLEEKLGRSVRVGQHFAIPQTHNHPTAFAEEGGAAIISDFSVEVLTTVEFDRQLCLATREVDDEGRFDQLAGKGGAILRDAMPDCSFGRRGIVAQLACSSGQIGWHAISHAASLARLAGARHPPPAPPFQGGESTSPGPVPSRRRSIRSVGAGTPRASVWRRCARHSRSCRDWRPGRSAKVRSRRRGQACRGRSGA